MFIIPNSSMHKQDFENISQSSIGSNAPPITTPTKEFHEFNNTTDVTCQSLEAPAEQSIIQSTLVIIYIHVYQYISTIWFLSEVGEYICFHYSQKRVQLLH